MARINNGFLGNASGKLGNVVFSKWRRLFTARQYQPVIKDANSPNQQKQRTRMVSLLEFLKPLNKTFIRSFNDSFSKNSTPWAKAIKDNMTAVSSVEGISLNNFVIGEANIPQLSIISAVYNPFIDQIHLTYKMPSASIGINEFPYTGISVLGKYKSSGGLPTFDTRHLLCCQPEGSWYCLLSDEVELSFYLNYWQGGRLWLILDEYQELKINSNPFHNISASGYFEAVPLIKEFNTDIIADLIPVEAITYEYVQRDNIWYLIFNIDFSKTTLVEPANHKLTFWGVGLKSGSRESGVHFQWELSSSTYELNLSEGGFNGSWVWLYSAYTTLGVQVSRFNRIYQDKGSNDVVFPYLQQLFDCNYSHPISYMISGNQCGFCGSIEELFSDFINLYEQGIIIVDQTPILSIYCLSFNSITNGNIVVTGYKDVVNGNYYFTEGVTAQLELVPAAGYAFGTWSGADAADLTIIDDTHCSILMSKNRELDASIISAISAFKILTSVPNDYGHYDISGYDHRDGDIYSFVNNTTASFVVFPNSGFVFSHWVGDGAPLVVQDGSVNWHLYMNANYTLRAIFNQNS